MAVEPAEPAPGPPRPAGGWLARLPHVVLAWSVVCVALGLTLFVRNRQAPGTERFFDPVLPALALAFPLAGALLASRRRRYPLEWVLLAGGVSAAGFLCEQYAVYVIHAEPGRLGGGTWAAWVSTWAWAPPYLAALTLLPLLFPDGHPPSPRWRPVVWAVVAGIAATTLAAALSTEQLASPAPRNPLAVAGLADLRGVGEAALLFGMAPVCLAGLVLRHLRSPAAVRAQLAGCVAALAVAVSVPIAGLVLALSGIGVPLVLYQALGAGSVVAVAAALVWAVTRRGLEAFDVSVNTVVTRALVDVSVVVAAAAVYVTVLVLAALVPGRVGPGSLLTAVVVAALAVRALRHRIQGGVDRFLYRTRDYDYDVLASLGQRLRSTLGPDAVLPVIAETVASALKLPYVAIVAGRGGEVAARAAYGSAVAETVVVPLVHQNEEVGRLVVAPRRAGQPIDDADRRLLDELAAQTGVAAYALCLATDLQRSREKLVAAREEERRRLRRDLHDGLKPTLAGVSLGLDAVCNMLGKDAEIAGGLLGRLRRELDGASDDIRRLVHDLRPPALDELGLIGALRQHTSRFQLSPSSPDVTLDAPAELPDLPAAVEVAAYRIGLEALENVRTHAAARSCAVSLRIADAHLELEVSDDGGGVAPESRAGVGSLAMQERAAELGGSCSIESEAGNGTCVRAKLPLDSR